ncbi:MAG TPA: SPOR domain-containing protein [Burkholderiaceae bacterium]|nr:SPOR domain-containing protein [Burkholderiaceae bacterium]
MLRLLVLILLLANGVYYAWSQGLLKGYGFAPASQSEPQRISAQIRPEALKVLPNDDARKTEIAVSAPASDRPAECLQAGPFDDTQTLVLRKTLEAALPVGAWQLDSVIEPARWIVYMGKYVDAQAVAIKRGELASLNLKVEPLVNPALEFGFSIGAAETRGGAEARLEALKQRGVKTAKVVEERPEVRSTTLRITAADDVLKAHAEELKPALVGKPLRACK